MNILPDNFTLAASSHKSIEDGACIMEAVSWLNGEPWSDQPACACDVISAFLRRTNDEMDDETRQILLPLAPKLVGTRMKDRTVRQRRAFIAADWAVRYAAPAIMRSHKFTEQADKLEACVEIVDATTAKSGRVVAQAAATAAANVYVAAYDYAAAAYDGARRSAAAAARAAANAYAANAYAAAAAATAAAAANAYTYAAANAAARKRVYALPTREGITLAASAVRMVERMIEVRS